MSGAEKMVGVKITQMTKVSWFDLRSLLATAAHAFAAGIIGSMTGRREIMAALPTKDVKARPYAADANGKFWLDYMADCGDGWDASHSVAWLLGRNAIALDRDGAPTAQPVPPSATAEGLPEVADTQLLPAGKVLMLGGDQVYPSASADNYEARFENVMRSARSWQEGGRDLYAIPGNHDWYDGLTNFIRLFCQVGEFDRRWFGAWRAIQRRSYFSVRLPHGWWLWGVDMALADDLDPPQLAYFRAAAEHLGPDDRVILCVPAPSWLARCEDDALHTTKLQIMIDIVAGCHSAIERVPLILSGDLHYYARHEAELGEHKRQYITCGGGGAFTLGTGLTPLSVGQSAPERKVMPARMKISFPDAAQSSALRKGVLRFPRFNPGFSALLSALQLVVLWLLSAQAWANPAAGESRGWLAQSMARDFSLDGFGEQLCDAAMLCVTSPGLTLLVAAIIAGFGLYGRSGTAPGGSKLLATVAGALHGLAQIVLGIGVVWLVAKAAGMAELGPVPGAWVTAAISGAVLVPLCGLLFGFYLFASHIVARMHDLEVYSAQAIERFKSFLRMRITAEELTIFPVGLAEPAHKWRFAPGVELVERTRVSPFGSFVFRLRVPVRGQRIFDPDEPLAPQLIEQPITITRSPGPDHA